MRLSLSLLYVALPSIVAAQNPDVLPAGRYNRPGTYALTNVSVIDGTGAPATRNQTIVVAGGIIRFVGDATAAQPPADATVLDLRGSTVLPGLVMMHEHVRGDYLSSRLLLAHGVTTVRNTGSFEPIGELNLRRWIREGRVPGPELFLTSPALSQQDERLEKYKFLILQNVRDSAHARTVVAYWASEGFDAIKVYRGMTPAMLRVIVEEAHRLGLHVSGHLQATGCKDAAEAGLDSYEHGLSSCLRRAAGADADALIATVLKHGMTITETPVDDRPLTEAALAVLAPDARADYERMIRDEDASLQIGRHPANDEEQGQPGQTVAFVRAGGRVMLGADAQGVPWVPGFANLRSLKLLYSIYGFTPIEAIQIATLNGATFLRIDGRTGSIAEGKEADLLVVRGDPSVRMKDIDNIQFVFSNGVLFDSAKMLEEMKGKFSLVPRGDSRFRLP
jgi:imidazolonepropionase-like amidohydrolase